eukprot:CAMPEP_0179127614 /NCGR_PEP_ID=MMETSP0796-20121207/60464_1 /TAXON_ID=73915 /ORGANISM="Pyrodinium bahamense, Strain pbaha01" /LENGTH=272 /DNA_ID=CAMNT_0020826417 /DNA_START=71 /DNA_END=885 /DNA_ORIENTATION=+
MNPSFLGTFAQLGCLGALQREGLLRHLCGLAGASAGAMTGAIIASGRTVLEPGPGKPRLHADMLGISTLGSRRWDVLDPGLGIGLLKGHGFEREMAQFCAGSFEELHIPFVCTAFSAYAMRTEVLWRGPLPRAVRASATVPGLLQPTTQSKRRWLFDGGIADPSGSAGLSKLPWQPRRSLHVVVNRSLVPPLDSYWTRALGPSRFGAARQDVLTLRLNRPPDLLLGDRSFRLVDQAILSSAAAVLDALDAPLQPGSEKGHHLLEVDLDWSRA